MLKTQIQDKTFDNTMSNKEAKTRKEIFKPLLKNRNLHISNKLSYDKQV